MNEGGAGGANKNESKNNGSSGGSGNGGARNASSDGSSNPSSSSGEAGQRQERRLPSKPWHNTEADEPDRNSLAQHIVELLKLRRPNDNGSWQDKLPQMAKRLDDALYFSANSKAEYIDRNTLKTRLQQLALAMGGPKGQNRGGAGAPGASGVPVNPQQQQYQQQNFSQQAPGQYPETNRTAHAAAGAYSATAPAQPFNGQPNKAGASAGTGGNPQNDEHRRQVLKQQQQIL